MIQKAVSGASPKGMTKANNDSTPFASLLKKVDKENNAPSVMIKDPSNGEFVHPFVDKLQSLSQLGDESQLEEIKEVLDQLLSEGLVPQSLDQEMLTNNEQLPWMAFLPMDLLEKIEKLFQENSSVQEVLFSSEESLQVENVLASFIYLNQLSEEQVVNEEKLLSVFQHLTKQLHQLGKVESEFRQLLTSGNGQLVKELDLFFSQIHTKLPGQQSIAMDPNNDKLDYLKALFERSQRQQESGSNHNMLQDSSSKVMVMGVENQNFINRAGQFALFVDQHASKPVNQEQFIKDFQSILAKSTMQNAGNGMKLLIKLYPEQLGQLRIELIQQQGVLVARMMASTAAAKDLLESQLQGLKTAFANQNIQVEKLEIINAGSLHQQFERSLDKDGSNQGFTSREQKKEDDESTKNGSSFEDTFKNELLNTEV
jgi:hypothetical protein